jgi:hypothetical protein
MSHRLAPALIAAVAILAVGACAQSPLSSPPPLAPSAVPSGESGSLPPATPFVPPTPAPSAAGPTATAGEGPDSGNVEEPAAGPMLSIELVDATTIRATLEDPAARAWRIDVAGTGQLAGDRLSIVVETGDVAPMVTVTEIHDGRTVSVMDLSGFGDPTAAAGGCHATLTVCVDNDGIRYPARGDGTLVVNLTRNDGTLPLAVTGSTAGWPGEPFILGPWTDTESFPWDPAPSS